MASYPIQHTSENTPHPTIPSLLEIIANFPILAPDHSHNESLSTPSCLTSPTMDSQLRCRHDLQPILYTSKKQLGRQFYRCPKPIGTEQCDFFLWADEVPQSSSQTQVLPPTPQSAHKSRQIFHEPPSTPTPLSRKRTSTDEMMSSPTLSWQSQKRPRTVDLDDSQECPAPFGISSDEGSRSDEMSADGVAQRLKYLTELPEYIRRLERRKVAAEMSRDAKARKILDLEAEVARLKRREKELENLVVALESAQH